MIRLEKLNVVVEVDSEARAAELVSEGYTIIESEKDTHKKTGTRKTSKGKKKNRADEDDIVNVDELAGVENAGDGK